MTPHTGAECPGRVTEQPAAALAWTVPADGPVMVDAGSGGTVRVETRVGAAR